MPKTKKILSIFLTVIVSLWSIGIPSISNGFTTSDAGFSNNSSTGRGEVLPGTANVVILDFNLPNPAADTIIYTGTESLNAGDALTLLPSNIYFADNDNSGTYNDTIDEAIVSSTNATLDNSDIVVATGTAALLAFTTQTWYVDADGGNDYDNGEAIVTSTDSNLTAGVLNGAGTDIVFNNGSADIEPFATSTFNFDHSTGVDGNYDDGEAIIRNSDGTGQLTASTSNIIIKAGDADYTRIDTAEATSTAPAGAGSGWRIRITPGTNEIWEQGDTIWIDVNNNGWTTSTDVVLVSGTNITNNTMWSASSLWASTTAANFGYLDSNHDGFYTYTTETGGEPLIRTGVPGQADDYDIGTNAEDEFLDPMDASGTYQDINNNWVEDWIKMSTLTNLGYVNADHGTPSQLDFDEYDSGEAIIREAVAPIDGNLESSDTVVTSGSADLTNFDATNHRFADANHDGFYTTTTQEAIILNTVSGDENKLSESDTVVTSGSADLVAFTSAYTTPKFDDSGGTGIFATNGSDSILLDGDASATYSGDKFQSIQVNNTGTGGGTLKIWVENGTTLGFQANQDTEVGSGNFGTTISTSTDPGVYSSSSNNRRMYVTVNIPDNASPFSTIVVCIPVNGIQLVSTNDGPTNAQICDGEVVIVPGGTSFPDSISPSSIITTPGSKERISAGADYTILGYSTDSGGSNVKEVNISLDGGITWELTMPLVVYNHGFTWKYIWKAPAEGTYTIKARAEDHVGNIETPGAGVTVTVAKEVVAKEVVAEEKTPVVEEVPVEKPVEKKAEIPVVAFEKPISQMTVSEIQAKIAEIMAVIETLQSMLKEAQAAEVAKAVEAIPASYKFEKIMKFGESSDDVRYLQEFLKAQGAEIYPEARVTGYFGPRTKAAVVRFQEKYASEILKPAGLVAGTGFVGKFTQAKINAILGR